MPKRRKQPWPTPTAHPSRKIDSAGYFEVMAREYTAFIATCRLFQIPNHVTLTMDGMVIHLRRAAFQLRTHESCGQTKGTK